MTSLSNQVILVTGATDGLGRALATDLARNGATVLVHGRDPGRIASTIEQIQAETGSDKLRSYLADLSSLAQVRTLAQQVIAGEPRLDVLVNNAGITGGAPQTPTTVDPATVRATVETNVIGVIRVTNAMLPLLRRSASPRIVNMSSSVGSLTLQLTPGAETGPIAVAYAPSKTFLNAVTVQYAKELHDTNILINAACPGFVATDLNGFRGVRTPEQGAAIAIRLATLPDDGPTGAFFDDSGVVPW
jgi:NAD(P)-dependent dehydrogenase (short-subunit alcohol dehydrogenase family)